MLRLSSIEYFQLNVVNIAEFGNTVRPGCEYACLAGRCEAQATHYLGVKHGAVSTGVNYQSYFDGGGNGFPLLVHLGAARHAVPDFRVENQPIAMSMKIQLRHGPKSRV